MYGTRTLKPRHGKGALPLPATFSLRLVSKNGLVLALFGLLFVWFFVGPTFRLLLPFSSTTNGPDHHGHPLTSPHEIPTTSKYIYPNVEEVELLKELTVHKLVHESKVRDPNFPELENNWIRPLNDFDDPNPFQQKIKEDDENAQSPLHAAKNHFKNHDKIVYRPKSLAQYPEIVIVTAIDYEKYSAAALTKIVQNRVDYGHKQNYGVYVRWYQEFLPVLNSLSYLQLPEKAKWVRLYTMRAAMHAFPHAKWFWYLEQDAFVMNLNIDLHDYLLAPEALDPVMLREQPIMPLDGAIKTYKGSKADSMRLIVTQADNKLATLSYLVKNDEIGRAIVETWGTKLFLNYANFPSGPDSALTHILQWHPFVLSSTSIIPARTIASKYTEVDLPKDTNAKGGDHVHYFKGDLVAHWADCGYASKCEELLHKCSLKMDKYNG